MKRVQVEQLKGGEVLEKDILTEDFLVILSAGTTIKKEYIKKLMDLNIKQVCRKPEGPSGEAIYLLKQETEDIFKEKVKNILEKHIYQHNKELEELCNMADKIITSILDEEKVVEQVYDIKERNADIYEHSISICTIATLIGLKMELAYDRVHDMGVGCLLHDIGLRYLTVPFDNQPTDELPEMERAEFRKHPVYGYTALKDEEWISNISKNIILCHHEHIDGSGYPLHASSISMESKIVGACDAFDELISGIGCTRVKVYEAIEFMKIYQNVWYDKEIVNILLQFTAMYPVGTKVITNKGEIAVVVGQNKSFAERPIIQIVKDANGNDVKDVRIIDLIQVNNIVIMSVVE
jgi:HD-GYP domain-containing protein (c-di-GMP phosphodiesterase class II)